MGAMTKHQKRRRRIIKEFLSTAQFDFIDGADDGIMIIGEKRGETFSIAWKQIKCFADDSSVENISNKILDMRGTPCGSA